jgi:hypothetical protein
MFHSSTRRKTHSSTQADLPDCFLDGLRLTSKAKLIAKAWANAIEAASERN